MGLLITFPGVSTTTATLDRPLTGKRADARHPALPDITPETAEDRVGDILDGLRRAIEVLPEDAGYRGRLDVSRVTRRQIKETFGVLDHGLLAAVDQIADALAVAQGARRTPDYFARRAVAINEVAVATPHFLALIGAARADVLGM